MASIATSVKTENTYSISSNAVEVPRVTVQAARVADSVVKVVTQVVGTTEDQTTRKIVQPDIIGILTDTVLLVILSSSSA